MEKTKRVFVDESEAEIKAEKLREFQRRLHARSAAGRRPACVCCNTPAGLAPTSECYMGTVGKRGRGGGCSPPR